MPLSVLIDSYVLFAAMFVAPAVLSNAGNMVIGILSAPKSQILPTRVDIEIKATACTEN